MKNIKDELQHIILGHEPADQASQLKKTQRFLKICTMRMYFPNGVLFFL
ncbi:MAG: hypothetical protein JWP78_1450 [Mucilaginibacter sp.]|nr:hypothetical protein [Mucilaginibacter sp.]